MVFTSGQFHINEGQPCHPYSQILIKFCSNVPTYKKQKWAKFLHLTLNGSWDVDFSNLGNFRVFFPEIHHFKFSVPNEIVITWVFKVNLHENLHLSTFLGGKSKNHIKNWPCTRNRSSFKLKKIFFITAPILPHYPIFAMWDNFNQPKFFPDWC